MEGYKLYDHRAAKISYEKSSLYVPGYVAKVTIYVKSILFKIKIFRMNMKTHPVKVDVTMEKDMNLL